MQKSYIGMDIGGTAIKTALVNEDGSIVEMLTETVNLSDASMSFVDFVIRAAVNIRRIAVSREAAVAGVGVSSTGQIDPSSGCVVGTCLNIPGLNGVDLQALLQGVFHQAVTVQNDGNCAVLAEKWLGAGQPYENIVMYTIGTGIGGGLILNGRLYAGARGIAGELGHMAFVYDGQTCTCQNGGCFEQYASTSALIQDMRRMGCRHALRGEDIFALFDQGDTRAGLALDQFFHYHARGIVSLTHIFNPDIVILGGGISAQGEKLVGPIRELVMRQAMPAFTKDLMIEAARLGNTAGILGAVRFHQLAQRQQ